MELKPPVNELAPGSRQTSTPTELNLIASTQPTHNAIHSSGPRLGVFVRSPRAPGDWEYVASVPGKSRSDRAESEETIILTPCSSYQYKTPDAMPFEGVDLTAEAGQVSATVSWHEPHPIFAIILVGVDEVPFGIQKDLLCAQSPFYKQFFGSGSENQIEHVTKLPDTDTAVFGCFQNFIYTGSVYDKRGGVEIPDYNLLMGVWKLAIKLQMAPLRIAVLETMAERRQATASIPGAPLLIQAWEETEEGSGLRKMLIGWAAEHMRASPTLRNVFAKSLPHEILTELVVVMSDDSIPAPIAQPVKHALFSNPVDVEFERAKPAAKRARKSDVGIKTQPADDAYEFKPSVKKAPRRSEPIRRQVRRVSGPVIETPVTPEQDLDDCRLLVGRMLSAPSYWTRYVKYFREPVDPVRDNAPNYFAVVKRPMDLKTIQTKMSNNEYASAEEFEADIRLIFQNCYEYWTQDDAVFKECEIFENFFNRQWAQRHIKATGGSKIKAEVID